MQVRSVQSQIGESAARQDVVDRQVIVVVYAAAATAANVALFVYDPSSDKPPLGTCVELLGLGDSLLPRASQFLQTSLNLRSTLRRLDLYQALSRQENRVAKAEACNPENGVVIRQRDPHNVH